MISCKHCIGGIVENEIGEQTCFCELTDKTENISLGDCIGNCKSQEPVKCCLTCTYWNSIYQKCDCGEQRQDINCKLWKNCFEQL